MASTKKGRPGGFRHHERPADPAEEADRPLEPKARPRPVTGEGGEPGAGTEGLRSEPPHHRLNHPVGEPDPTTDSDPYDPDPEAADPPPPGLYPGPGPEADDLDEPDPRERGQ